MCHNYPLRIGIYYLYTPENHGMHCLYNMALQVHRIQGSYRYHPHIAEYRHMHRKAMNNRAPQDDHIEEWYHQNIYISILEYILLHPHMQRWVQYNIYIHLHRYNIPGCNPHTRNRCFQIAIPPDPMLSVQDSEPPAEETGHFPLQ